MRTHTSTGEWQSFEVRMRHRRAERLLLRAEAAADAGLIDEARATLEEARTLAPNADGVADVEARIAAAKAREAALEADIRWSRRARVRRAAVVLVVGGLVAASAAAGTWLARVQRVELPPAVMNGMDTVLPAEAPALRVETEALDRGQISVFQSAVGRSRPDPATSSDGFDAREVETPHFPPASPQLLPTDAHVETLPSAGIGSRFSTEPPPPPVAASAPAPTVPVATNDEALVHGVLDKYASAYSHLDVDAASAAWPGVNRSALARAFDGLASQQVSLGSCDVSVKGTTARAACHGTATWRPKVGGGEHIDARTWTFDLARASGGWQIVDARVQNR